MLVLVPHCLVIGSGSAVDSVRETLVPDLLDTVIS